MIDCFLIPHPGLKVATSKNFKGEIAGIHKEFIKKLKELVALLLSPKNVVVKKIGGQEMTGLQLLEYLKVYVKVLSSESHLVLKTLIEANVEATNLCASNEALNNYLSSMRKLCQDDYIDPNQLNKHHENFKNKVIESFNKAKNIVTMNTVKITEISYHNKLIKV